MTEEELIREVENNRHNRALWAFDWMATEIVKQSERLGEMEIALSASSLTTVIRRSIYGTKK